MRLNVRRGSIAVAAAVALAGGACSLLLDHSGVQCRTDSDCLHVNPSSVCEDSLCVKVGPPGCFRGTATTIDQFLNHCGTGQFDQSFSNCVRIHLCSASDAPPDMVKPTSSGPPMMVGTVTTPTASCFDADARPQVIYIAGSSNFIPLLQKLAPLIAGYTPVFQQTSSCAATRAMYSALDSPLRLMKNPPSASTAAFAQYFPADGSAPAPCLLPDAGATMDIGESEIFPSTCGVDSASQPATGESFGPMSTMVFAVPIGSTQVSITAEAAFEVFGVGGDPANKASPWQDPAYFFIRNLNTATQQMIGRAIHVPADSFWGTDQGSAGNVQSSLKVVPPANQEGAIGILSTDYVEKDDKNLKSLAFQAESQTAAYRPDSTTRVRDKKNVRDGHYPIWGPLHFFALQPPSDAAKALLEVASPPAPPQEVLDAYISSSLVPECAMMVERNSEDEILSPHSPPAPCGCYFDSKINGGTTPDGCQACSNSTTCPGSQVCNFGFCEKFLYQ
jgi:hypothetical protein